MTPPDWGLTKGGIGRGPPLLHRLQALNEAYNRRHLLQRLVRAMVHDRIRKLSSSEQPGEWAEWWAFIRRTT